MNTSKRRAKIYPVQVRLDAYERECPEKITKAEHATMRTTKVGAQPQAVEGEKK